jgi:hypothetical protein
LFAVKINTDINKQNMVSIPKFNCFSNLSCYNLNITWLELITSSRTVSWYVNTCITPVHAMIPSYIAFILSVSKDMGWTCNVEWKGKNAVDNRSLRNLLEIKFKVQNLMWKYFEVHFSHFWIKKVSHYWYAPSQL